MTEVGKQVSQKITTDEVDIQMSDPQNQTSESRKVGVAKNHNRRPLRVDQSDNGSLLLKGKHVAVSPANGTSWLLSFLCCHSPMHGPRIGRRLDVDSDDGEPWSTSSLPSGCLRAQ
jgi:hypothetical protein